MGKELIRLQRKLLFCSNVYRGKQKSIFDFLDEIGNARFEERLKIAKLNKKIKVSLH